MSCCASAGSDPFAADVQRAQPQLHRISGLAAQILAYALQDPPLLDLQALAIPHARVASALLTAFARLACDVHCMDLELGKEPAWLVASRTAQLAALQHLATAANGVLQLMTPAQVMDAVKDVEAQARPAPGPGPLLVQCAEVLVSERCGDGSGLQLRVACLVATLLSDAAQAQLLLQFEDSSKCLAASHHGMAWYGMACGTEPPLAARLCKRAGWAYPAHTGVMALAATGGTCG